MTLKPLLDKSRITWYNSESRLEYTYQVSEFTRNRQEYFVAKVMNSGTCSVYSTWKQGGFMLKKEYVRDGKHQVIGSITSEYTGAYETIVKDEHEQVLGTTSERFGTTRDGHGALVSTNTADAGLLIGRKK
jgi:hypothetical protein